MNDYKTLHQIQALFRGEQIESRQISEFLWNQKCYDLLLNIPSEKEKALTNVIANYMRVFNQYKECECLLANFNDFPYAIIKGAVLAEQIYPSVGYRVSKDLDILVSPKYLKKAEIVLKENGFIQGEVDSNGFVKPSSREQIIFHRAFTHQSMTYVKTTGNPYCPILVIDINHSVLWGEAIQKVDVDDLLNHIILCDLFNVKIKKLDPIFEFISICLHHYRDLNSLFLLSTRGIRLSQFCDIVRYLEKNSIDVTQLKRVCDYLGVVEYVTFCLYHTNVIFPSDVVCKYLEVFHPYDCAAILNRIGLESGEYKIIEGGISSWAVCDDFKSMLQSMLTSADKTKIDTNLKYRGVLECRSI